MKLRTFLVYVLLLCLFVPMTAAQDEDTIGEVVTIEGEVLEILSPNSFVISRTEPFDFAPSDVIVFNDNEQPFDVDVNVGRIVQVTGRVNAFNLDDVNNQVGYEVDTTLYGDFASDDFIIVASQVTDAEGMTMGGNFDTDEETAIRIQENPNEFVGQTLTVEGFVTEIVDANTFRLENITPFNLRPSALLVTNNDMEAFQVDVNRGRRVQVTGTLQAFNFDEVNSMTTNELDPTAFDRFDENDYIMIADSVTAIRGAMGDMDATDDTGINDADTTFDENEFANMNNAERFDMVEDNPLSFVGANISLEGEVEEIYSANSFLLEEDEFFDLNPMQIPVFSASGTSIDTNTDATGGLDDALYRVAGRVVAFNLVDIENEIRLDLDDNLYTDFGNDDIAIIASEVTRIED